MKYLLSILVIFCLANFNLLAQNAKFSVDHATHKFPKTKEGTLLEHTFKITNTGSTPLILSDYEVACDCTKLFLPKEPIAPGKTVDVRVTFDTKGKSFFQDRIIYITSNTKSKTEKLRIKVSIEE